MALTNELYNITNKLMEKQAFDKDLFLDLSTDEKSFVIQSLLEAEYKQLLFIRLLLLSMQEK